MRFKIECSKQFVYLNKPSRPLWAISEYGPRHAYGWNFKVSSRAVNSKIEGINIGEEEHCFLLLLYVRLGAILSSKGGAPTIIGGTDTGGDAKKQ